jgi:hypothetical protein
MSETVYTLTGFGTVDLKDVVFISELELDRKRVKFNEKGVEAKEKWSKREMLTVTKIERYGFLWLKKKKIIEMVDPQPNFMYHSDYYDYIPENDEYYFKVEFRTKKDNIIWPKPLEADIYREVKYDGLYSFGSSKELICEFEHNKIGFEGCPERRKVPVTLERTKLVKAWSKALK